MTPAAAIAAVREEDIGALLPSEPTNLDPVELAAGKLTQDLAAISPPSRRSRAAPPPGA